jgi:5-methyltetrahydropteroyltriglutamate--homocysteine methyltransferase
MRGGTELRIQTTVVGSYPVPEWLRIYPTKPHVRDATLVVVRTQELAGIEVVTDGELSRFDLNHPDSNGMVDYFVGQMEGVKTHLGLADLELFASDEGLSYRAQPPGVVVGPIGPGTLNLPEAARPLRELSRVRTKFTLTSPYQLARTLVDRHYGDMRELCMAIADVLREQVSSIDADVVQVDEAHLPGNIEDGEWAAEAINRVLEGAHGERAVHICFGNYGGQIVHKGSAYERFLPAMNALNADYLVLEFARRGYEELEVLRDLDERIGVGLGVIDTKDNVVESADEVARRIERAEKELGEGRVRYVHPDCGFWMLQRSVVDAKIEALVAGRDLYLGSAAEGSRHVEQASG